MDSGMMKYAKMVPLLVSFYSVFQAVVGTKINSRNTQTDKEESGLDGPNLQHERHSETE
jgi:hypothetical protein